MTKAPYTDRKIQKATWKHKNATKNFDYTTIAEWLRTVSWSNDSPPTSVVKPVNRIPTLPLTTAVVKDCLFLRSVWCCIHNTNPKFYEHIFLNSTYLAVLSNCTYRVGGKTLSTASSLKIFMRHDKVRLVSCGICLWSMKKYFPLPCAIPPTMCVLSFIAPASYNPTKHNNARAINNKNRESDSASIMCLWKYGPTYNKFLKSYLSILFMVKVWVNCRLGMHEKYEISNSHGSKFMEKVKITWQQTSKWSKSTKTLCP